MAVLGWILLGVLALCVFAVMILVATPLFLRLSADAGAGARRRVVLEARTLWGLTPPLRVIDSDRPRKNARKTDATPPRPGKRKRKSGDGRWRIPRPRVGMRRLFEAGTQIIGDELARIHLDRLDLDARIGTGDPAETGRLYGYLTPLIYGLPRERWRLAVRPDFDRAVFEGRAEIALHLVPVALLGPVIGLIWNIYVRPT